MCLNQVNKPNKNQTLGTGQCDNATAPVAIPNTLEPNKPKPPSPASLSEQALLQLLSAQGSLEEPLFLQTKLKQLKQSMLSAWALPLQVPGELAKYKGGVNHAAMLLPQKPWESISIPLVPISRNKALLQPLNLASGALFAKGNYSSPQPQWIRRGIILAMKAVLSGEFQHKHWGFKLHVRQVLDTCWKHSKLHVLSPNSKRSM